MLRVLILFGLLAIPAQAETVKVSSGEHSGFSRLVLSLPTAQGWNLGRTAVGYELALDGDTSGFDVSGVFDLIPRDRLNGIYADPVTGNLQMTIGCACHALPFSLDASTIVIDLRDGPAPDGSSFEMGLNGANWPALQGDANAAVRPRFRQPRPEPTAAYDWLTAELPELPQTAELILPELTDQTGDIRQSLISQLAEGAARNVVELQIPENATGGPGGPYLPAGTPIRISGELGLRIGAESDGPDAMQPNGAACLPDEVLDVAGWVPEDASPAPYSGISAGLVGEFDRPQETEVIAAAKRYIYLGFGAEARALLLAFPVDSAEALVLRSLSELVDGENVAAPNGFDGMAGCQTTAAFWAYLAAGDAKSPELNTTGLMRGFSGLPSHLRLSLGPKLADMLLERGETNLAVQVREAMGRGIISDNRAIALVSSDVLLAEGKAEQAIPEAEQVLADPGDLEAEATIALVKAQIAAAKPVAPGMVTALEGLLKEYTGDSRYAALADAYILALAGAGEFSAARSFAQDGHDLNPAFWQVLADFGTDDDLLIQTMLPGTAPVPADAMAKIANRLAALGFLTQAAQWNGGNLPPVIALVDGAGQDSALENSEVAGAAAEPAAADTAAMAPGLDLAAQTAIWAADWPTVAELDDGSWGQLSQKLADGPIAGAELSLQAAAQTIENSQQTRSLIADLISSSTTGPQIP